MRNLPDKPNPGAKEASGDLPEKSRGEVELDPTTEQKLILAIVRKIANDRNLTEALEGEVELGLTTEELLKAALEYGSDAGISEERIQEIESRVRSSESEDPESLDLATISYVESFGKTLKTALDLSEQVVEKYGRNKSSIEHLELAMHSMRIAINQLVKEGDVDPSLVAPYQFTQYFEGIKSKVDKLSPLYIEMRHSPEAPVNPLNEKLRFVIGKIWVFWIEFNEDLAGEFLGLLVRFKRMYQENEEPGSDEPSNEFQTYVQPHGAVPGPFDDEALQPGDIEALGQKSEGEITEGGSPPVPTPREVPK